MSRAGPSFVSPELDQLAREAREDLRAIRTEEDVVLDPNAAPPRSIDSRLDRHHRAFGQRAVGRAGEPRRFVHFQSETVAKAVAEQVPISALLNVVASDGVGIPAGHPGPNALRRVLVGGANNVVDLALLRRRHDP